MNIDTFDKMQEVNCPEGENTYEEISENSYAELADVDNNITSESRNIIQTDFVNTIVRANSESSLYEIPLSIYLTVSDVENNPSEKTDEDKCKKVNPVELPERKESHAALFTCSMKSKLVAVSTVLLALAVCIFCAIYFIYQRPTEMTLVATEQEFLITNESLSWNESNPLGTSSLSRASSHNVILGTSNMSTAARNGITFGTTRQQTTSHNMCVNKDYEKVRSSAFSAIVNKRLRKTKVSIRPNDFSSNMRYLNQNLWVFGFTDILIYGTNRKLKHKMVNPYQLILLPHFFQQTHTKDVIALSSKNQKVYRYAKQKNKWIKLKLPGRYSAISVHACELSLISTGKLIVVTTYRISSPSLGLTFRKKVTLRVNIRSDVFYFQIYRSSIFVNSAEKLFKFSNTGEVLGEIDVSGAVSGMAQNGLLIATEYDKLGAILVYNTSDMSLEKKVFTKMIYALQVDVRGNIWCLVDVDSDGSKLHIIKYTL